MDWLIQLFTSGGGVAHTVILYAAVIAAGVFLGNKIKFGSVSLGVTWILFVGILAGDLLMRGGIEENEAVINFIQDFGLILFVFSIGLQVGPSFFTSLKQGGLKANGVAAGVVLLNIVVMIAIYYGFRNVIPAVDNLPMLVGTLCGAVTNTPGLGAANAALEQINQMHPFKDGVPVIANGYACAYPLGVVGIIGSIILIRVIFKVNFKAEEEHFNKKNNKESVKPHLMTVKVFNPAIADKTILQVRGFIGRDFVCSRMLHNGHVAVPNKETLLNVDDRLYIVCAEEDAAAIVAFIGPEVQVEWDEQDVPFVSKQILVTQPRMNGKTFGSLHFSSVYGVNVTRIRRGGMNLFADRHLRMQVGDKLVVVGPEDAVDRVASMMGNSVKSLDTPNLAAIFVGILVGIIFGSIPFALPGVPTPVKLGLAGGPLIVAILVGRFGYKAKLVAYTTTSANLMLREVGLALFLASVGVKAGATFAETVLQGDGLTYVWCGFLITLLPALIVGLIARLRYKLNYFTLMGFIAGSTTNPPALAFANQTAAGDSPSVGYSTVYPLSMFLRILTAQLIVLLLCFA